MDYENFGNFSQQSGAPMPQPGPNQGAPVKKVSGWKVLWGIITGLSVLANIALFLVLIGMVFIVAAGRERKFSEEVLEEGPSSSKIAVISIEGIIDEQQARNVFWQLKEARNDHNVKGLVIRINSPGGTLSGSDQIYNEILKYRSGKGKPVVAFMQGVAASGGYYASVACETIVAEPTTITGSIGVIMGYLVLEQLLEEKLGIQPIIVKAGDKKDWPSSFQAPDEQQLEYIQKRIVDPAYERFVEVVAQGRSDLSADDVNRLADGSIYWADEAKAEGLIDEIGYLEDAVDLVKSQAGIDKAKVVEYRRPFSFADIMAAQTKSALKIDRTFLYELSVPQVLYLWTGAK